MDPTRTTITSITSSKIKYAISEIRFPRRVSTTAKWLLCYVLDRPDTAAIPSSDEKELQCLQATGLLDIA